MLAPIVLFVYNRPSHTRQTLKSLKENELADQSELFIFADGPKSNALPETLKKIKEVRRIIREEKWCKTVTIVESDVNCSLPVTLVEKVTEIVNHFGKIIVLEDDLVLSKGFLKYMNDALSHYENDEKVMHISGYMYPTKVKLQETSFLILASCWGWGTWKRAWDHFDASAENLLKKIKTNEIKWFDLGFPHYEALQRCAKGPWKSWDIRWHASVFVEKGLCLHPRMSLVRNIGHDGSGVHCSESEIFSSQKIIDSVSVEKIKLEVNKRSERQAYLFQKNTYSASWIPVLKDKLRQKAFIRKIYFKYFKKAEEKTLEDWSKHSDLLNQWGKSSVWNELKMLLINSSGKVLDIGCGTGAAMKYLAGISELDLYGIDISEDLLKKCIENGISGTHLKKEDLKELKNYKPNSFDYTYSVGVLHYINKDDLIEFARNSALISSKSSFHLVSVSLSENDEGWIRNWHLSQNNSTEWWRRIFLSAFPKVEVIDSAWNDKHFSKGKWFICSK